MRRPETCPLLLTLLVAVPLAACAPGSTSAVSPATPQPPATPTPGLEGLARPPGDRLLFVEVWVHVEGTGHLPGLMIDFPGYRFDQKARVLKPFGPATLPALAPGDWGFLGSGSSRGGAAGGGAASGLKPINELPHVTTIGIFTGEAKGHLEELRQAEVILESVDAEGRLAASIDGERVLLAPGQSWERVVEADVTLEGGQGRYRVTSSVTNHGWLERSRLGEEKWAGCL